MHPIHSRQYGACPNCGAPNLRHRRDCYVCHAALGNGGAIPDASDASQEHEQPSDGVLANRRRYPREDVPVRRLTIEGDGIPRHEAYFRNVSAASVGVLTTIPCPLGAIVRVEIVIEGRKYRAGGTVRHSSVSRDGLRSVYLVGIQFTFSVPPLSLLFTPRDAA